MTVARLSQPIALFLLAQVPLHLANVALAQAAKTASPVSQSAPISIQTATKAEPAVCLPQLASKIDAIANQSQFRRNRWGILIQTLDAARNNTLYARDAEYYFLPASNAKLLTTAAALYQLGPQFQIRTPVYGTGTGARQDLRLVGQGDPTLTTTQLNLLAQQLYRQGIRQVGQLVVDDTAFRGEAINPTWEWEDIQSGYGTGTNSLILNQNAIDLTLVPQKLNQPLRIEWADASETDQWQVENLSRTVGSSDPEFVSVGRDFAKPILQIKGQLRQGSASEPVAVAVVDPAQRFLRSFQQALNAQNIQVAQARVSTKAQLNLASGLPLAAIASPPLIDLIKETNQESNNLYAEALLRILGARQTPNPAETTATQGLNAVTATLTQLGIDPRTYVLVDASGLSRHNLVTPVALVQTLRAMAQLPRKPGQTNTEKTLGEYYRESLAIAGVNGTLQNRFRGTPAAGILQAKTGSLSGVAALSGYLNPPQYSPLVFSILVNQSANSNEELLQAIDEIVLLLTRLRAC